MSDAALGFKPRTGRAVMVIVARDGDLRVLERSEVALLPKGEMAPYHAAEDLSPRDADRHVKDAVARAKRIAAGVVRDAAKRCADAGHRVRGCGVLVGKGLPRPWTTGEILAVHVRMHMAEGEMFRDLLVEAARASGVKPTTLPDKTALDAAAAKLRWTRAKLDGVLAKLGKDAGPPWGRYEKEAAAAALAALGR